MADKNSLHSGHRERMKQRYREHMDLKGFADHEILEMLLFYCYSRRDTNKLAHQLISRFGSIENVLSADVDELISSGLLGENPAYTLKFFNAFHSYLNIKKVSKAIDGRDIPALKVYISSQFSGEFLEKVMLFFVDSSFRIKKSTVLNAGSLNEVVMDLRLITKTILNSGCDNVFIAHNHPEAKSKPSQEDVIATRNLIRHLSAMDITLLDHFICGDDGVSSLRQLGLIYDYD